MALRLARFFGNSVEFRVNRQTSYDIEAALRKAA
jgi:plasmid maintenance system antidote protein VapI